MENKPGLILTLDNALTWANSTEKYVFVSDLLESHDLPANMQAVQIIEEYFEEILAQA